MALLLQDEPDPSSDEMSSFAMSTASLRRFVVGAAESDEECVEHVANLIDRHGGLAGALLASTRLRPA